MKCEMCKGETVIKRDHRYHYTECGLDNVYLEGIDLRVCESCGEASPRIPALTICTPPSAKPSLCRMCRCPARKSDFYVSIWD